MTTTNRLLFGSHAGPLGANDGSFVLGIATVTLTDAQIKTLPTTPIQIVAAPGAGKMIVPILALFSCDASAAPYSNFNDTTTLSGSPFASSVYLAWDAANNFNDATGPVIAGYSDSSGGLLKKQSLNVAIVNGVNGNSLFVNTNIVADVAAASIASLGYDNADLSVVGQNNGLGDFQGGNAANSMRVTVVYMIVDL